MVAPIQEYGMTCPMIQKGNGRDNAPTDSWVNSIYNERVLGVSYASHTDTRAASSDYLEVFYNRKRLHSTLGHRSLVQFVPLLEPWISHAGKTCSVNPTLGKTKNKGNLIQTDILNADALKIVADWWRATQCFARTTKCGRMR